MKTIEEIHEQTVEILERLVSLKDYKNKYGKDEVYKNEQPILWKKARETLALYKSEFDTVCALDFEKNYCKHMGGEQLCDKQTNCVNQRRRY